ncbi:hypothetical protein [Vibrio cincinnatiensis]|uniref:hypothetical protein n=1 Tax=Vibrio cincinnatiensis TaxID=675 RepID=UPI001EDF2D97|nr:hypothetical protein [Vibrio cincinnatiensis]MCG3727575.1 hypothetical protein [Vibrio cincinnatiensis]
MTVYRISDRLDEYQALVTTPDDVAIQLGNFDLFESILLQAVENRSLQDIWHSVDVEFEDVLNDGSLLPDISLWLRTYLVLSPKAYEILKYDLQKDGEFLPIRYKNCQWYLYTALKFGQEDTQKCVEKIEYGSPAGLEILVFIDSDIENKIIFKSQMEGVSSLYCTDKFKSLCEEHRLNGIAFSTSLTSPFE